MKTIRTIRQVVERDERVAQRPEFQVGDYVEVYSGQNEGHHFWIKDVRFNHDVNCFEYLYGGFLGGWHRESNIILIERKVRKMDDET